MSSTVVTDEKKATPDSAKEPQKRRGELILGLVLALVFLILLLFLITICCETGDAENIWKESAALFIWGCTVTGETRLLLLVILSGGLGSFVHAATSYVSYVGNRSMRSSWYWWYYMRPFIGIALALMVYFAFRGGLMMSIAGDENPSLDPYAVAAMTGLAGMFSKQAADKLREVFDSLFKSGGDAEREDKLGEPVPVKDVMLKLQNITTYRMAEDKTDSDVLIKDLYDIYKGPVTRIPVVDAQNRLRYIIHQSLLFKFISRHSYDSNQDVNKLSLLTLADFIAEDQNGVLVRDSVEFVSPDTSVEDAKRRMEAIEFCQDVFVTKSGKADEPILGWLTNNDIARHLKA